MSHMPWNFAISFLILGSFSLASPPSPQRRGSAQPGIVTIITAAATGGGNTSAQSASYDNGQWLTLVGGAVGSASVIAGEGGIAAAIAQPNKVVTTTASSEHKATTIMKASSPAATKTSALPAKPPNNDANGQDRDGWLLFHNSHRRSYGAPDLRWDYDLSVKASVNAKSCLHEHFNAGENIAWYSPGTLTAKQAVEMWMSESELYTWGKPHYNETWGHFTQVIWKNTQNVGCFVAACDKGSQATCEYDPAGNFVDAFAENVSPPV